MAGRKLSAKVEEEVVWMENVLFQQGALNKKVEEYASAKKGADAILQTIVRQLSFIRQQGMIKNLGPLADSAGLLATAAMRGSQIQRVRTLRDGLVQFKALVERTMKAAIEADQRDRHLKEKEMEAGKVARAAEKAAAAAAAAPVKGEPPA